MSWREWFAKSVAGDEVLHLVLTENLSPRREPDEPACQLVVYRHYLSQDREMIAYPGFADVEQAKAYCLTEYGVAPGDWIDAIRFRRSCEFNYKVSSHGVYQAYPERPPGARIVFRSTVFEDENGQTKPGLCICGNRQGFETLAAMFMLFADSEEFGPDFHIHVEDDSQVVETELNVTIRPPAVLGFVRAPEFREYKGTNIPIPTDDSEDSSPQIE
jgi:hypothetical protein